MAFFPYRPPTNSLASQGSYLREFVIQTDERTAWEDYTAASFASALFACERTITLRVEFSPEGIVWKIHAPREFAPNIQSLIYTHYSKASFTNNSLDQHPDVGGRVYRFLGMQPYVIPFRSILEFKQPPMRSIIAALSPLADYGHFSYTIQLEPVNDTIIKLGQALLTRSSLHWTNFLTIDSAIRSVALKYEGRDRKPTYSPQALQSQAEAKVSWSTRLRWIRIGIVLHDLWGGETGLTTLVTSLKSLMSAFYQSSNGYNHIVAAAEENAYGLIVTPNELSTLWHLPTAPLSHPLLHWHTSRAVPIPLLPTIGKHINLGYSDARGRRHEIPLSYADRTSHVYLAGKSGMGKSTLMLNMIRQDIANGEGVGIIDPHGDLVQDILRTSISTNRLQDVVLFSASDTEYPIGLNVFDSRENVSVSEKATRTVSFLAQNIENWNGGRMEDVLYNAVYTLYCNSGTTLQDVIKLLYDDVYRRRMVRKIDDPLVRDYWEFEYNPLTLGSRQQLVRPIAHRLRTFLRDMHMRRILCQSKSLNLRQLMDEGKIFLVDLGGLSAINAKLLGSLLISKIQIAGMSRANVPPTERKPYYMYVDEVQNFITTSLDVVFSEARKYGLIFTVANQFLDQLEGKTLNAILGNVGAMVCFRVGEKDARLLQATYKPKISHDDLINLDRYVIAVKMQANGNAVQGFTGKTYVPPSIINNDNLINSIRLQSRREYGRKASDIDDELRQESSEEITPTRKQKVTLD